MDLKEELNKAGPPPSLNHVPRPIVIRSVERSSGMATTPHSHDRAQLLYAIEGVMSVTTDLGIWVIPPQRAVWIPTGMVHAVQSVSDLSLRNIYFDTTVLEGLPTECTVVTISPLLREIIKQAAKAPTLYDEKGEDGRLMAVLLDQIKALPVQPLHLPLPRDIRLRVITDALQKNPADNRSLDDWSRVAGASSRTLARLFLSETGINFREWRQQARLLAALERLAHGDAVTTVAMDLGYGSQSAFIAMFKKALGTTPGKYFSDEKKA